MTTTSNSTVLAQLDPTRPYTHSVAEDEFAEAVCELVQGLTYADLAPQYAVEVGGHTYFLDFAVPFLRIAAEIDGLVGHASPLDIARDHKRQRLLEAGGWRVIRFGGREVYFDAPACAREFLAFISQEVKRQRFPEVA